MNKNKGFTLIELLVVIAIIGILASIVLASLSNARDKGKDASVKSQLSSMRAQAELYFSNNEAYYTDVTNNVCVDALEQNGFGGSALVGGVPGTPDSSSFITPGPGLILATQSASAIPDPKVAINVGGAWNRITCQAVAADPDAEIPEAWAVDAPMSNSSETEGARMYCVDSLGTSRETDNVLVAGAYKCS